MLIHNRILSSNQLSFSPLQGYQIKSWFEFDFRYPHHMSSLVVGAVSKEAKGVLGDPGGSLVDFRETYGGLWVPRN